MATYTASELIAINEAFSRILAEKGVNGFKFGNFFTDALFSILPASLINSGYISTSDQEIAGIKTLKSGLTLQGEFNVPLKSQLLTSITDTILSNDIRIGVSSVNGNFLKLSSTPTISPGVVVGQQITITNVSPKIVILQNDEAIGLVNSKLKLRSPSVALAERCSISLYWDGNFWVEENRNTYGTPGIVNVRDFGADNTGVVDASAAINAAIQSMSSAGSIWENGIVVIPQGKYKLESNILLDRNVVLEGIGAGGFYGVGLFPSVGVTGILQQVQTNPENGNNPENTTIKNLAIIGPNGIHSWTGPTAHGIDARNSVRIENVAVFNMNGNGLNLVPDNIADLDYVSKVDIYNCAGDGVYIHGGDANAGLFMHISAVACGGWGVNDDSFLGNTHIGHHTNGNYGSYRAGQAANYSLWLGCYSEGGQREANIGGNGSMVIGGDHGAGVADGPFKILEGHSASYLLWRVEQIAGYSGTQGHCLQIGGQYLLQTKNKFSIDFAGNVAMSLASRSPGGVGFDFPFTGDGAQPFGNSSWLSWFPSGGESIRTAVAHYLASFPNLGNGLTNRTIEPSASWFDAFYLGGYGSYGGNARRVASVLDFSSISGVASTWHLGDIALNAKPTDKGSPLGWICKAPGTYGTYSEGRTATYDSVTGYGYVYLLNAPTTVLKVGDHITINNVAGTIQDLTYSNIDNPGNRDKIVFTENAGSGSGYTISYKGPPLFKPIGILESTETGLIQYSQAINNGNAIASLEDTTTALTADGAQLKVWSNNGAAKASIDKDGAAKFSKATLSSGLVLPSQTDNSATGNNANIGAHTAAIITLINSGLSSLASMDITGIVDGSVRYIHNVTSNPITLINDYNAAPLNSGFLTGTGSNVTIAADSTFTVIYSTAYNRWKRVT